MLTEDQGLPPLFELLTERPELDGIGVAGFLLQAVTG